jgi:uncharacterized RDD family membrane protein YckC
MPWRFKEFAPAWNPSERNLTSPEGAILTVTLATRVERLMAFTLDFTAIVCLNALIFALPFNYFIKDPKLAWTITAFMSFVVNNVYFIFFELALQGSTPGKRSARLKVVSRKGGALTPYAVAVRNFTRQFEILMPLMSMFVSEGMGIGGPVFAAAWFLGVTLLPLWNSDRMRAGDMLAGTLVIVAPSKVLDPDLAASGPGQAKPRWSFTKGQLAIYGDYELLVLEEVLRKSLRPGHEGPLFKVAHKIAAKIGAALPPDLTVAECRDFLTDFYSAERASLEEGRLYGIRKTDQTTPAARGAPAPAPPSAPTTPSERFRMGRWD